MELEAPVEIGVDIGDGPAAAGIDRQQASAPLIMIEADDADAGVCAADGSGC